MNSKKDSYQRIFDIILSTLAIIILSPILITVSFILIIVSGDGIIYKQKRVGKNGKLFNIYKFVTMIKNSEQMGTGTITLKNDFRIFPFGRFLRKTKINELPQLFNILKGDMSIVGPRPQDIISFNAFHKKERDIIIKVKPGLSCIGPIFFRDEDEILDRSHIDKKDFYHNYIAPYKGQIEAWYVENRNIYLYFILIWLTIKVVIFPKYKINFNQKFETIPAPPKELKKIIDLS